MEKTARSGSDFTSCTC